MAQMGFPPMLTGHGPLEMQRKVLASWTETTRGLGGDVDAPKLACPIMLVAETDREAEAMARHYVPRWYQLQVQHYAFDVERHANVAHYESFRETHKRRQVYCDPANLDPLIEQSLIGSAATVRRKVERLLGIGYTYILVQPSIPSVPGPVRQEWLTRFGRDVMPYFTATAPRRASA